MKFGFEQQRGNRFFDLELNVPLILTDSNCVSEGSGWLGLTSAGNNLILNKLGHIAAVSPITRETLWAVQLDEAKCQHWAYEHELYLLVSRSKLTRRDSRSGELIWETDLRGEIEAINLVTNRYVYTVTSDDENSLLHARSKEDGRIIWTLKDDGFGVFSTILCENGIIVLKNQHGCRALVEESGELLWDFRFEEWLSLNIPSTDSGGSVKLGLFVDGIVYLVVSAGYIAAIRSDDCELQWVHKVVIPDGVPQIDQLRNPSTLIHRNGELLFNIAQGSRKDNFLTVLNVTDGEIVFQSERNISPSGCINPLVVGSNYVGGYGSHLSIFDIDQKKFIFEWVHPKKAEPFGTAMVPFNNKLVTAHIQSSTVFWFEGKG